MARLIIICIFFCLSLLTMFKAPTNLLWYVSILVTEFPLLFISAIIILSCWRFGSARYHLACNIVGLVALLLFSTPIIYAFRISQSLNNDLKLNFNQNKYMPAGLSAFSFVKMITGSFAKQLPYKIITYDTAAKLTLDFYPSAIIGNRPCIIVVHGGSWSGGDSGQLPGLNSYLSNKGYHVASLNYRLAPQHKYPAPVEDVYHAMMYLEENALQLGIDTNNFVLLGRSAGAQIVLSAAYRFHNQKIKGVVSYYGPTDMVWGYAHPSNPLVLNSRKIMEDYLGGTYNQVPHQYVESSPTETAACNKVPTLLIHGKNDPLVAYEHSTRLSQQLKANGTPFFVLTLPWATHGCDYTLNGPSGQLCTYSVEYFLQSVTQ